MKKIRDFIDRITYTNQYSTFILIIIFGMIFIGYFGIYSLLGNSVVLKSQGSIVLSETTSIFNILIGVLIIGYILLSDKK